MAAIKLHYFDANATAPLCAEARAAWLAAEENYWANPASPSALGSRTAKELERCRATLAGHLGVPTADVVFTSGATEANNAVLAFEAERNPSGTLLVSVIEHPSVLEAARKHWKNRVHFLPVDADGRVSLYTLEEVLRKHRDISLVSLMAANNETGVLQPWREAVAEARNHGARFHCDATQWIGRLPAKEMGTVCDYVTGSGHKFGGPKGTGFLALRAKENATFAGQLGGGQENHRRAGTVNFPALAGMLAALEASEREMELLAAEHRSARAAFEQRLKKSFPSAIVHGGASERLWNTVAVALPRHGNLRWLKRLERHGFVVSTGSACATADNKPSHVLAAMGCADEVARRTLRVSAAAGTTAEDWRGLAQALEVVARELDADEEENATNVVVLS